ncbi:hypothetical protein ABVT39_003596 [Epinephelus coioides]
MFIIFAGWVALPWVHKTAGGLIRSALGHDCPSSVSVNSAEPVQELPPDRFFPPTAPTEFLHQDAVATPDLGHLTDETLQKRRELGRPLCSHSVLPRSDLGSERPTEQDSTAVCTSAVIYRSPSGGRRVNLPTFARHCYLFRSSFSPVFGRGREHIDTFALVSPQPTVLSLQTRCADFYSRTRATVVSFFPMAQARIVAFRVTVRDRAVLVFTQAQGTVSTLLWVTQARVVSLYSRARAAVFCRAQRTIQVLYNRVPPFLSMVEARIVDFSLRIIDETLPVFTQARETVSTLLWVTQARVVSLYSIARAAVFCRAQRTIQVLYNRVPPFLSMVEARIVDFSLRIIDETLPVFTQARETVSTLLWVTQARVVSLYSRAHAAVFSRAQSVARNLSMARARIVAFGAMIRDETAVVYTLTHALVSALLRLTRARIANVLFRACEAFFSMRQQMICAIFNGAPPVRVAHFLAMARARIMDLGFLIIQEIVFAFIKAHARLSTLFSMTQAIFASCFSRALAAVFSRAQRTCRVIFNMVLPVSVLPFWTVAGLRIAQFLTMTRAQIAPFLSMTQGRIVDFGLMIINENVPVFTRAHARVSALFRMIQTRIEHFFFRACAAVVSIRQGITQALQNWLPPQVVAYIWSTAQSRIVAMVLNQTVLIFSRAQAAGSGLFNKTQDRILSSSSRVLASVFSPRQQRIQAVVNMIPVEKISHFLAIVFFHGIS